MHLRHLACATALAAALLAPIGAQAFDDQKYPDLKGQWRSQPIWWTEDVCAENNVHITIGKEVYFLSGDGLLMPTKIGQPPPDLRYFNRRGSPPL